MAPSLDCEHLQRRLGPASSGLRLTQGTRAAGGERDCSRAGRRDRTAKGQWGPGELLRCHFPAGLPSYVEVEMALLGGWEPHVKNLQGPCRAVLSC